MIIFFGSISAYRIYIIISDIYTTYIKMVKDLHTTLWTFLHAPLSSSSLLPCAFNTQQRQDIIYVTTKKKISITVIMSIPSNVVSRHVQLV